MHRLAALSTERMNNAIDANSETEEMVQRDRRVQILAKSLYRDMTAQGFAKRDIVNLATALLDQLTTKLDTDGAARD